MKTKTNDMQLLLQKLCVRWRLVVAAVSLAVFAALLEGASMALLIPTLQGMMKADFLFLYDVSFFGDVLRAFPEMFYNRNAAILTLLVFLILLL